jgi:WD40 repeat protein
MHRFVLITYAHACTQAATSRHATLEGHQDYVRCVAISGDATFIVSVTCIHTCIHTYTFIVSGNISGALKVWDRHNRVCTFTLTEAHAGSVHGMNISKDDTLLVSCGGTNIKVWRLTHKQTPTELHMLTLSLFLGVPCQAFA